MFEKVSCLFKLIIKIPVILAHRRLGRELEEVSS